MITPQNQENEPRSFLWNLLVHFRFQILFFVHTVVFAAVLWCAFLMRFTLSVPSTYVNLFWVTLPVVLVTKLTCFYTLGSFHGWWRYVHFSDVISLMKAAIVASLAVVFIDSFFLTSHIPRIVIVNDFAMTVVVLGGLRSIWRIWDERIAPLKNREKKQRALMLGSDFRSSRLAHLINSHRRLNVRIVGMVSQQLGPSSRKHLGDIRIVGKLKDVSHLMAEHRASCLFTIAGSITGKRLRELLDIAAESDFEIKIIPSLEEQLRGTNKLPIREVNYNDLLRRDSAQLDLRAIEGVVHGKSVMVTGAGGSIGSELCRQLMRFGPRELILLGRGENRIYEIERELRGAFPEVSLIPKIVNITDKDRLKEVFDQHSPSHIFHAAAHKHVPLVEQNVGEAIINNVLGTKNIADLADQYGVDRFVMVSTDKAVNPTSVMGCTKHMAERYCQTLGGQSKTKFISTRFGNVLGSAGSVVPLFQKQIQDGGPITITDRKMTRYFMTIPEASQLVVQAASMGKGGEIFVLEMGEPVKILDLAQDLIRLAGQTHQSIEIVETGIRPGEKLFEELYYVNETSIPTSHEKILSSKSRQYSMRSVEEQVLLLVEAAFKDPDQIRSLLKTMIPEFSQGASSVPPLHIRPTISPFKQCS